MLMVGDEGNEVLSKTRQTLQAVLCRHELFNPSQLKQRFPMMTFGPTFSGLLDHEAGILHPDRCVAKLQVATLLLLW